jgi:transketolase
MDDIRASVRCTAKRPGHPEFFETPGVECTTGPLGQGVGNAVGVAMAAKMAAARFNTPEHTIFDQHVICLAGDGCLQEGVVAEACAFAGHFGLDNLILITMRTPSRSTRWPTRRRARQRQAIPGLRLRRADDRRHDMTAFCAR